MKKKIILIGMVVSIVLIVWGAFVLVTTEKENKNSISIEPLLKAEHEGVLSEQGKAVLNTLTEPLDGESGTLAGTAQMEIGYLAPMPPLGDRIMVFILGIEVEKIEQDALSWLRSRGFSDNDICALPVVFSIVNPAAQTTNKDKLTANYLPPFCPGILGTE
jgi:hypothetical protein